MKTGLIWKILLVIGLCPFAAPLILAFTSSWAIFNPIVMYSVVFWPTYIIGFIFLTISIGKIKSLKEEEKRECQRAREAAQARKIKRLQNQVIEANAFNIHEVEAAQNASETQE